MPRLTHMSPPENIPFINNRKTGCAELCLKGPALSIQLTVRTF